MLGPHGADMSLVGNISQLGDTISVFVSQSALFEPDGGQQSKRMQNRLHRKAGIHGEVSSSSGVVTGMILMNVVDGRFEVVSTGCCFSSNKHSSTRAQRVPSGEHRRSCDMVGRRFRR